MVGRTGGGADPTGRRVGSLTPIVATFETTLSIPCPLVETFAFVSDFRNAVRWDPRTYAAEKTTDGPIGVGTRFVLSGGLLPEARLERLHVPRRLVAMSLSYDVSAVDPPDVHSRVSLRLKQRERDKPPGSG